MLAHTCISAAASRLPLPMKIQPRAYALGYSRLRDSREAAQENSPARQRWVTVSCIPQPRSGGSFELHRPVLQFLLNLGHELVGGGAVDHAVIERQRQDNYRADRNGIIDDDSAFLDSAHAHDGDLRLIDNGRADQAAVLTRVCNGECPVFDIVRRELFVASALTKIVDRFGETEQILLVCVFDDRNDQ